MFTVTLMYLESQPQASILTHSFLICLIAGLLLGLAACGDSSHPAGSQTGAPDDAQKLAGLQNTIAALEHRKSLIEDANDIKRLQRAYGYYFDQALWNEVADLFADDGSIEIGLDGVYVGKKRIRQYLYALGNDCSGLSAGQLNEHMQVMPVITVAPDGMTAKGRWRAIIMGGELGKSAFWGEGPYENEYVKHNGVWKIQKLHWYQSMMVPYESGWQNTRDMNGGKWVSHKLPPDLPPSVEYKTWPDTYLPPFHFPNPVAEKTSAASTFNGRPALRNEKLSIEAVEGRIAILSHEVQLLEDENDIENLQRIYGFYTDKQMWSEAANLFAEDGTIEIGGHGVFVGKDRIHEYLRRQGPEFPQDNRLFDQMQLQPIVHVAPDGRTAKARWRMFAQEAVWSEYARWGVGVYQNGYVKEGGVWKIKSLHAFTRMYTPYEDGWGKTALPNPGTMSELPPDRPPTVTYQSYPAVFVVPFHYENPVTGNPAYPGSPGNFAETTAAGVEQIEQALATLHKKIGLLEDADQIERLSVVYGYYLARNQWDDLAAIFSRDGSIEVGMRGIYVGPASVRRNLNLYGEAGISHGLLHNHMQFQPVIHVAPDGQTAKMRSRAFSIMGEFGISSRWMGGIYENEFIKEDGVWKIKRDQLFNTYFALYDTGWKNLALRPPPGITESNPPDLPPSMPFEMYPKAFLPPYHYQNPATGKGN